MLGALGREIGRGIALGGVDGTDRQRRRDAVIGGGLVDPGEPSEGQGQGGCPGKDTLLHLSSPSVSRGPVPRTRLTLYH